MSILAFKTRVGSLIRTWQRHTCKNFQNGMVTRVFPKWYGYQGITYLVIDTLPATVIKRYISLLPLGRYLLPQ